MKKMKLLLCVLLSGLYLENVVSTVNAAEMSEESVTGVNQLMTAVEDVEAKETPDAKAGSVITYKEGSIVYVTGETADGWYQVFYQGIEGFVMKESLKSLDIDLSALEQETEVSENEGRIVVEEVERTRTESNRTLVWGIVIVAIVMGIFLTGVLIASIPVRRKRRRKRRRR